MNKQLGWQEQIEKRSKCINKSWNDQTEFVAIMEIQIYLSKTQMLKTM
jgi:hypothetical protein